jgi:hypothetical protein
MFKIHNHSTKQSSKNILVPSKKKQEERFFQHNIAHLYIRLFKHRRIKKKQRNKRSEKKKNRSICDCTYVCKRKRDKNYTKCANKCVVFFRQNFTCTLTNKIDQIKK